jgi:hypothetical protein
VDSIAFVPVANISRTGDEELDYTPWLSKEENIKLVSDEIGIEITNVRTEVKARALSK